MGTLHVIEAPSVPHGTHPKRSPGEAEIIACRASLSADDRVLAIAPDSRLRVFSDLGLSVDQRLPPRGPRVERVRKAFAESIHVAGADRVLCWSDRTYRLARSTGAPEPSRAEMDRVGTSHGSVDRTALRARLGISERELAIAAAVDPAARMDAKNMLFLLGVMQLMGQKVVACVSADSDRLVEARRYLRTSGLDIRMLVLEGSLAAVHPACDVVLVDTEDLDESSPNHTATSLLANRARGFGVKIVEGAICHDAGTPPNLRDAIGGLLKTSRHPVSGPQSGHA